MHRLTAAAIISSAAVLVLVAASFSARTPLATAQSCVPVPSGIVSWWRGERDASDHAGVNDGQEQGAVTYVPGVVGEALHFDGSDHSWVNVPHHATLNLTSGATLEFWYKSDLAGQTAGLVAKRAVDETTNYGVNDVPWGLGLYYNDPAYTGYGDDHNIFETVRVPSPNAGQFHHFAGTYEQLTNAVLRLTIYIDGALVKSVDLPGRLANTVSDTPVAIGTTAERGERFLGDIDEVTIYDRALAAVEVEAIYGAGSAGKCLASPVTATATSTGVPTHTPTALPVPTFKQTDSRWASTEYDHASQLYPNIVWCGTTIRACGCALTSLAMMLSYYGVASPDGDATTPLTLNTYLSADRTTFDCDNKTDGIQGVASRGYICGGVSWWAIPAYSQKTLELVPFNQNKAFDVATARQDIHEGRPVIVKVPESAVGADGTRYENGNHWVVATGILGDSFSINDPRFDRESLAAPQYNNAFVDMQMARYRRTDNALPSGQIEILSRGLGQTNLMATSEADSGMVVLGAAAPDDTLVTRIDGLMTGRRFDGTVVEQIPDSGHVFDPFISDTVGAPDGAADQGGLNWLWLDSPAPGQYTVSITGSTDDVASLAIYIVDDRGDMKTYVLNAHVDDGQTTHVLHLDIRDSTRPVTSIVAVDIKPDDIANIVNCRNGDGLIPVAVLSSASFDAMTVDFDSVRFAGAIETHRAHGAGGHREDVDGDGDLDALFHFRLADTNLSCASTEAELSGVTSTGLPIAGLSPITMRTR